MRAPASSSVIFRSRSRARCQELWAVLDAAQIPARIVERGWACLLVVRREDLPRAVQELDDYRREGQESRPAPQLVTLPGGWAGMLGYWVVLVGVAGLVARGAFGADSTPARSSESIWIARAPRP